MNNDKLTIQVLFSDGGIGDCIARLVPLIYLNRLYPNCDVKLFVPDYFKEFAKRCLSTRIKPISFSEVTANQSLYVDALPTYSYDKYHSRFNNLATHMVDHAFNFMNFQPTDLQDKNYPKVNLKGVHVSYSLPEKYAVMAVGFTSSVREWLPEHINKVSDYLVQQGITPVYLGKSASPNGVGHVIKPTFRQEINYNNGINLIDKLDLLESAKVISKAQFTVGLDSGLTHVTGCTTTPLIVGYTSVAKEHRLPYREGVLGHKCYPVELTQKELACIGCQSRMFLKFNHKFTECPETHLKCLKLLTGDKYIEAIRKCIDENSRG
jgi:ADP-heptose:LPS heptosyltransferase